MSDSTLQVDKIIDKAATSNKELATYASGNWSWGSGVPAGTVLQVVHGALATNFSTTTNGSWVDVNQKATITPSATSSKIFIIVAAGLLYNSADNYNTQWGLMQPVANDNANLVYGSDYNWNKQGGPMGANQVPTSYTMNILDSPSSTSALTYGVMIKGEGSGTSRTNYYNAGHSNVRFHLGITLMEIKG